VAYHVVDFNGYDETAAAIKVQKPKIIVWLDYGRQFPQLSSIVADGYIRVEDIEGATIFRLIRH
jgi:hypothetical protein